MLLQTAPAAMTNSMRAMVIKQVRASPRDPKSTYHSPPAWVFMYELVNLIWSSGGGAQGITVDPTIGEHPDVLYCRSFIRQFSFFIMRSIHCNTQRADSDCGVSVDRQAVGSSMQRSAASGRSLRW